MKAVSRPRRLGERARCDAGDTLIEVLVALLIFGLAGVSLIILLGVVLTSSAQHRSLATIDTLLKSFAETARSDIELAPPSSPPYAACTTTVPPQYHLLSTPTPTSGGVGTAVTVFGTGFTPNTSRSSFRVTIGPDANIVPLLGPSQSSSDSLGNMQATFLVPSGLNAGTTYPITLSDGSNSAQTIATTGFTITGATNTVSPVANYTMGITSVESWDSSTGTFDSSCAGPKDWGLQQVNLQATSPHSSSTLSFVVRNPTWSAPPKPAPTVSVGGSAPQSPFTASPGSTITFTALVSPPLGYPTPSGSVAWAISAPPSGSSTCVATTPLIANGTNTASATCTTSSTQVVGSYSATATYSGDGYLLGLASTPGTVVVTANPAIVVTDNNANPGNSLVFTAKITPPKPPSGSNPAPFDGTVVWNFSSPSSETCSSTTPVTPVSGQSYSLATCTVTAVTGLFSVTATYSEGTYYPGPVSGNDAHTVP